MAHPTLIDVLGSMLGRFVIGTCATVFAAFCCFVLGALSTSSEARALIMFVWFVCFSSIAWALLPAIRFGKRSAKIAGVVWLGFGLIASNFGNLSVRGYPLPSWIAASIPLLLAIFLRPPKYFSVQAPRIERSTETDRNDIPAP